MAYKITLSDGTVLDNLELNGNNFVSQTAVTEATFNGKLSTVTIEGPDEIEGASFVGTHKNMQLVQVQKMGNEYYFILRDLSPEELKDIKTRCDIEYIAMMTDVDLM